MNFFQVQGGPKLSGEIHIPGAKNAALPMFCAALLTSEKCIFQNVPDIVDLDLLLEIFSEMGAQTIWDKKTKIVEITAQNLDPTKLEYCEKARKFRASILMLGPLLARFPNEKISIPRPGGCILGARPNFIHTDGLRTLGAKITEDKNGITGIFSKEQLSAKRLLLAEASVTGTENLALFLAGQAEASDIFFAAAEPHVCGALRMLQEMGAHIQGIGTHHLQISGSKKLKGGSFTIPPDGILVGTYAVAGIITGGELLIKNVNHKELFSFYGLLKRAGIQFEMEGNQLKILPNNLSLLDETTSELRKIQTAIFPGFTTDLQAPMGVLATQLPGEMMIFETLFENRLAYLHELEKMGAQIKILNPHQAKVLGAHPLKGASVQSLDLRAGAAMVLAGLVAEGTTNIFNIEYIKRGYENFVENLQELGAQIVEKE